MRILLTTLLALISVSTRSADDWRSISFERQPKKNSVLLAVRSAAFSVTFNERHAWNVAEIRYKDRIVGQSSGATGTVIHWDGQAVGTGHGGEVVESLTLTLDGREVPLVQNGKSLFKMTDSHRASEVTLTRLSMIGPLRVRARFEFPAGTVHYRVTQSYEVLEAITPERFAGYKYAFMHMMPESFTEWLTIKADGTTLSGHHPPGKSTSPRDLDAELQPPLRVLACYDPTSGLGIAYRFPTEYPGQNQLLHRGGEDNKFRALYFRDEGYSKGERFEFVMSVIPFEATRETWHNTAQQTLTQPRQTLPR